MKTLNDLLSLLSRHIGRDKGIRVKELSRELDITERQVRSLVEALRLEGHAVCGHPKTGYFIAATEEELNETCEFLESRSMKGLLQTSRMKKISLPDYIGQIHLPT